MSDQSTIPEPPVGGQSRVEAPEIHREVTMMLDGAGVVIALDGVGEDLLGGLARSANHHPLEELVREPHRPALREALARVKPGTPALRIELELAPGTPSIPAAPVDDRPESLIELTLAPTPARLATTDMLSPPAPMVTVTLHDVSARRRAERVLAASQAITGALVGADSPAAALDSLLASLGSLMGWELGSCWTLHGTEFDRVAAWSAAAHEDPAELFASRFALTGSLAERALTSHQAQWTSAPGAQAGLLVATDAGERGRPVTIAIPISCAGQPTRVLLFVGAVRCAPDVATVSALSVAGLQIGELLGVLDERDELVASLSRLALTDELTGLPNRRAWEEAVRREFARALRDGHRVCIAVIDLDDFKRFNDEHGHQAGDRVLAASARAWQHQLRTGDMLARYGGEEFAALISAWPVPLAVEVVERVRLATADGLSASAGVAGWDGRETGEELFGRADAALYAAKQSGRGRTVAAITP